MANEENLRPPKTSEEAKERGRNGGIASGIARRKKRDMKSAAKALLDMPISFNNVEDGMKQMGIFEDDLTNQMAVMVSMFKEAMSGNVRAAEFLRETVGTGAGGLERDERLALDKKRFAMEEKRFKMEQDEKAESGDGMPTIINVRPDAPNE